MKKTKRKGKVQICIKDGSMATPSPRKVKKFHEAFFTKSAIPLGTKRAYTQEELKEIEDLNKLVKELKGYMCQTFVFGLFAADISDNAKNTLIEIQDKIKEKVNLADPNIFRFAKHAREKVESANHYFLRMTNQISNAIIKENGDTCLEYIQESSDMYCMFLRVFGIIFEQTQYDNDRLEIVWNTLVDLTKQFGLKIDENEPDWTNFKKVQEEVYKETKKQNI